jgi:hypothetical protein
MVATRVAIVWQIKAMMPGAPLETKGYKSIWKLSDWLASHRTGIVSKTPCQKGTFFIRVLLS